MTPSPSRSLRLIAVGVTLVVAGLAVPFTPAIAADPTPKPTLTSTATVGVTVPDAVPANPNTPPRTGNNPSPGGGQPGGTPGGGTSRPGSGGSPTSRSDAPAGPGSGPAAPTEPTIGKTPSATAERASVEKTAYNAGDTLTVSFPGFIPGENVQVVLYSEPILIGNFPADANGTITQSFQLPKDLPAGAHTVQLTGWESKKVATASIIVASAATAAAPAMQGVPIWAWWIGGVLLALLLAAGIWWLVRTMRATPAEVPAA
ncbi:hypothetical protein ABCS02_10040 [Microbacterium sp. X-17]|uniref:hypothetical protein n=1 Tax=Microbacterium sp. X-17 TaxID=3144404 RepID=UPI0031F5284E